ncbi:MFS transporter [Candidatus Uhrbacteria bacterium]|nr:MFS transporter [Candidatus Uhrbacteria bacterium]
MNIPEAKQQTKFFGLSKNVLTMGGVSFLNDVSSDMIFPYIPIFITQVLGAPIVFVGLVEGVADATASILKVVSGRLSDVFHRRKPLVVFGYSLSAFSKPLLALAISPWHVLVVRFFDRVGKGARDAPRDALLSMSTHRKILGRAFGFHRGADTLGAAVGPLLAFALLPLLNNNLRHLFLLSFVASFFAVLLIIFFVKEVHDGIRKSDAAGVVKELSRDKKFHFSKLGVSFFIFLAGATIFSLGKVSEAFLLLRAQEVGIALAFLPLLYFIYNFTLAIFSTPAGALSDRIGHRNTYMIGMFIFVGTYFLFATVSSVYALWIFFAFLGFHGALTEGVGRAIVADLVREEWRGTAYGMYNACTGIAALPASLAFGFIWDAYGPTASFLYGSFLGLLALVIFMCLRIARTRYKQNHQMLGV